MRLPPDLIDILRERHGVVNIEQLERHGVGGPPRRRLVEAGLLIPVHRGVYRWATTPVTLEQRCAAACLADPDIVVDGPTGARLWRFHHVEPGWDTAPVVVTAPHGQSPVRRGVILRRSAELPATDVVHRPDGIRVASPPRTWFGCARDLSDVRFEALTEYVIDRHASVPTLWATARRLCAPGRDGSARVRRVLSARSAWQKPADSRLELRVLRAMERLGVVLVRQFAVRLPSGIVVHLDGADPDRRWGIEVDHVTWHGGRLDAQRDKARDRQLRRVGWQVERVTDQDCRFDFAGTIRELIELHRLAGLRVS
jgi:very-short-patch-repair endonuclease